MLCLLAMLLIIAFCMAPMRVIEFTAPQRVEENEEITFYWQVENAGKVSIDRENLPHTGMLSVRADKSRTFILECEGKGKKLTKEVVVEVYPKIVMDKPKIKPEVHKDESKFLKGLVEYTLTSDDD